MANNGAEKKISPEAVEKAVRWKLGIPTSNGHAQQAEEDWKRLERNLKFEPIFQAIGQMMGDMLRLSVVRELGISKGDDHLWSEGLWAVCREWVKASEASRMPKLAGLIRKGISSKPLNPTTPPSTQRESVPNWPQLVPTTAGTDKFANVNDKSGDSGPQRSEASSTSPKTNSESSTPMDLQTTSAATPGSLWKYQPVPNDPDRHEESDARAFELPGAWRMIGARVRGKKHKHEGTNCDDFFEFGQAGQWTVIAVSDGAGSKKFSRVGAKAACTAAVAELTKFLKDIQPNVPDGVDVFNEKTGEYEAVPSELLSSVRDAIHRAVQRAFEATEAAVRERIGKSEYTAILNRELEIDDLSATLLLAVHCSVPMASGESSLVVACQVGDGMVGAVHRNGKVVLLGEADGGAFSGETVFLTSNGKRSPEYLARKTFSAFGPIQALLVMTDGVADDYFPNDPGLGVLWSDLLINRIPAFREPSADEAAAALCSAELMQLDPARYEMVAEPIEAGARRAIRLRSAAAFAECLGRPPEQLAASPIIPWMGGRNGSLCAGTAEERLRLWLDAYHVRGSFDDRTLVVLHREGLL